MEQYRVVISPAARQALEEHIDHIADNKLEPQSAQLWLQKALRAVESLAVFPNRFPIAPESRVSNDTIRMLIVDTSTFLYRLSEHDKAVYVTHFFHGGIPRPS